MSTDNHGNKTLYESISEAHTVGNISLSGIKMSIKEGARHNGLLWTRVDDADVQFWAPVAQDVEGGVSTGSESMLSKNAFIF